MCCVIDFVSTLLEITVYPLEYGINNLTIASVAFASVTASCMKSEEQ